MPSSNYNQTVRARGVGQAYAVTVTDHTLGNPWQYVQPSGFVFQPNFFFCGLDTDGTAGNRYVSMIFTDGAGQSLWYTKIEVAKGANVNDAHTFDKTTGDRNRFTFANNRTAPFPEIFMLPGSDLTVIVEGMVAGDKLYHITLTGRRWKD